MSEMGRLSVRVVPKSPRNSPDRYSQYWASSGLSQSGRGLALGDLRRGQPPAGGRRDRVADAAHQEEHQGDQEPGRRQDQQRRTPR